MAPNEVHARHRNRNPAEHKKYQNQKPKTVLQYLEKLPASRDHHAGQPRHQLAQRLDKYPEQYGQNG